MLAVNVLPEGDGDSCIVPLRNSDFINVLHNFKKLIASNIGAGGSLNLLVTGGGFVQLASSSSQLLNHSDQFESPIIKCIVNIMKGQKDFGLYAGVVITTVLEHFLSLQADGKIGNKQTESVVKFLIEESREIFNSNKIKIPVNYETILNFMPLVRTILTSKFTGRLSENSISQLSVLIVKAFLATLNDENMMLGKVLVETQEGSEKFTFIHGIVYQLVDVEDQWISDLALTPVFEQNIKVLLFTTSLDTDDGGGDECKNKLKKIFELLEEAISLGVNFIASQKVVDKEISLFLKRKSVILIQRMGTELATNLERISGAFPVSDVDKVSSEDLSKLIGEVGGVRAVEFGTKTYLVMECLSAGVGTLLVRVPSFTGAQQLKIVVAQALTSLRVMANYPYLCPGGGCFEVCLWMQLQNSGLRRFPGLDWDWLLHGLVKAAGHKLPVRTDTVYQHAWANEDDSVCNCRLLNGDMVTKFGGEWLCLTRRTPFKSGDSIKRLFNPDVGLKISPSAIVDSLYLKQSALIISFESCINLLNIGLVVYSRRNI